MAPRRRREIRNRQCSALQEDGSECRETLLHIRHTLCQEHYQEYERLHKSYKLRENDYGNIDTDKSGLGTREKLEAKLAAGKEILELRDQVNRRFFSLSAHNRGHIQRILRLQSAIRSLEQQLADLHVKDAMTPTQDGVATKASGQPFTPDGGETPPDHSAALIKKSADGFLSRMVDELYSISPSLNDSSSVALDNETRMLRGLDERDFIMRFLFREFLVDQADANMLAEARQIDSIDKFMRGCSSIEFLKDCCKFFTTFNAKCSPKLYLLRKAVCDYLLDPQAPSIMILGAKIAAQDSPQRMTTKGWDVLFINFTGIVGWWNFDQFAIEFEDIVLVKTLTEFRRYESEDDNESRGWYVPEQHSPRGSVLPIMHGFITVTRSSFDSEEFTAQTRNDVVEESQVRAYLVGRMSKMNPWARRLAQELNERTVHLQVLVSDGEDNKMTPIVPLSGEDQNPWLKRTRSGPTQESLGSEEWMIELSLADVIDNLETIHDPTVLAKDYYEFIVIERTPNKRSFDLLDLIGQALSVLKGHITINEALREAAHKYVPADELVQMMEVIDEMEFPQDLKLHSYPDMDNRVRSWEVPGAAKSTIRAIVRDSSYVTSLHDSLLISKLSTDLESRGIIARMHDYIRPHTCPVVIKGVDGVNDLYFDYDMGPLNEETFPGTAFDSKHLRNNLLKFCDAYKLAHPDAVFAKGGIDVPYCAWPMPAFGKYAGLNFCTPEGKLYEWKTLPFDVPLAMNIWEYYVNCHINGKFPFVRLVQTTLVICAENCHSVGVNTDKLRKVGEEHGWTFSIPSAACWTTNARNIGVGFLRRGVDPTMTGMW
ncbi:hypothetical protein NPX13_g465 [Xylaria arbuscula]|uniref:Uncharacterized protein n=1 Tax=Xylaria arbuscula TaxID=114810 RepID=A0A9W8TSF7_9PEZI|nr:hypothetical protein NPX13_g465 [Xylaria arbuscula]